jgi:S-formylglutathione hydrolase FrmB
MPQVHRSFYTDEAYGSRFWTFLSEELPRTVDSFFRLSTRREDTFVAGLSMGGYGALKWALRAPHRFAAAASLSGALDMAGRQRHSDRPQDPAIFERVYGNRPLAGSDDDVFALLGRADGPTLPRLYVCAGAQDALYGESVAFVERCRRAGIDVTSDLGDGEHVWSYWDEKIQDVLAWLPLRTVD